MEVRILVSIAGSWEGGRIPLSPRPTALVLNTAIPISPISPCLTFNAFRKTDPHFDHVDVIQGCFEGLVVLLLAALCV